MNKKPFKIGNRKIGDKFPPLIITEIGINHGGSLEKAIKIADHAIKGGAEVIKHQTHIVEDEMSSEAKDIIPGNADISIYEIMKNCALSKEDEYSLMKYFCIQLNTIKNIKASIRVRLIAQSDLC